MVMVGLAGAFLPRRARCPLGLVLNQIACHEIHEFFIAAQQISLLSAESCGVTARARQLDLEFHG